MSVAEALRQLPRPPQVLFVAGEDGPASDLLVAAGERVAIVTASPIKRAGAMGAGRAAANIVRAFGESRDLLKRERVSLVVGFGSYVSGGVLLAAKSLGIPTAIHEASTRVRGLANLACWRLSPIACISRPTRRDRDFLRHGRASSACRSADPCTTASRDRRSGD